jgi:eukaryotic-like serine/threonine-protein kinase
MRARNMTSRLATLLVSTAALASSPAAARLHTQSPAATAQQMFWVDRTGQVGKAIGRPQSLITGPVLSADGGRVLVRARDKDGETDDIWIHTVATGAKTRVTTDPAHDRHPDWSPGGDRVVFYSYRSGLADLFIRAADGSGRDEPLVTDASTHEYGPSWSPDGNIVAYHAHDPKNDRRELLYVTLSGARKSISFLPGAPGIAMPRISPDGRRIAYISNESGRWEVYVRAFPAGTDSRRISTGGGMWPKWSRHTDELFYFDGTTLMVVPVPQRPSTVSVPRAVFTAAQVGLAGNASDAFNPLFDVDSDGQRFVIVRASAK